MIDRVGASLIYPPITSHYKMFSYSTDIFVPNLSLSTIGSLYSLFFHTNLHVSLNEADFLESPSNLSLLFPSDSPTDFPLIFFFF
jgi:hypothetical protein